jgi:hypothetical protein
VAPALPRRSAPPRPRSATCPAHPARSGAACACPCSAPGSAAVPSPGGC